MKRVSRAFRNAYETALTGNAFRRALTGDRVNKPFLPSYVPVGARPMSFPPVRKWQRHFAERKEGI